MLLEVNDLCKSFGGLQAVAEVSFQVGEKELVSIIGPNGAGKSTLFNLITGHIPPDRGKVFFKGRDITRRKPHSISALGIGRSFQKLNIFPRLTAFQNVQVAMFAAKGLNTSLFSKADKQLTEPVEEVLESIGLAQHSQTSGGLLAHGDQKRLEMGIALALNPELLLLDEPTQGMSPGETSETTELIKRLVESRGIGLAFVEHDMKVVFGISDRINVMHQGRIIFSGKPEEVRANQEVQEVYLGKAGDSCFSALKI
jgi:branched-chain amino acid transport system ATP-binding protein